MNVLGVNTMENASACLVRDGRILAAAEEERFSRIKHQEGVPVRAIRYCLSEGGIGLADVDLVALGWQPWRLGWRAIHVFNFLLRSPRQFLQKVRRGADQVAGDEWKRMITMPWKLPGLLGEERAKCRYRFRFVDHHLCHAASAFYPSPFENAAVLTLDGAGESATSTFNVGKGARLRRLRTIRLPHSLGQLYAAATAFLGFKPCSGEGKVMGLASYGEDVYRNAFDRMLTLRDRGGIAVDFSDLDYHLALSNIFTGRTRGIFGEPRSPESPIEKRHEDIAASLQFALERAMIHMAEQLQCETGARALCLAGGVAMNAKANRWVLDHTPFEELFVQPAAGDNGTCLGAALAAAPPSSFANRNPMTSAFLGPHFSDDQIGKTIAEKSIEAVASRDIVGDAARLLSNGKIVGWFQGRMEFGARALGCRSILADPRRAEMKDILNARVKHREPFRPFAPAVLEENADEYFMPPARSPFMTQVAPVKPLAWERIPATVHVDGTARLQTVSAENSPLFYRLIERFRDLTGVPVIVNTSFNVRGQPIVCAPGEAIDCYLGTGMDALAIGNYLLVKNRDDLPSRDSDHGA